MAVRVARAAGSDEVGSLPMDPGPPTPVISIISGKLELADFTKGSELKSVKMLALDVNENLDSHLC